MEVDIACVGFGPATAGFLTTLSREILDENGQTRLESRVAPGMPLQVMCYERADDISFGVSGVVTRGRAIRKSFPEIDLSQIPMASPVSREKVVYLLDPLGASRRPAALKVADTLLRKGFSWLPYFKDQAFELPWVPPFLQKHGGFICSMGQFMQWVGGQLMGSGTVQIWPSMPVGEPLIENDQVTGIRMVNQGVDRKGAPEAGYMPGMDIRAALSVIGDGPVGAVGQKLNEHFGMPENHHQRDWAVGMKMVVELPESCSLPEGTVLHTLGFPEPEIFGFLYVSPGRLASLGIFVPTWFDSPVRTAYRYLQHWMMHPYIWKHIEGGTLRSWGAKTIQESGRRGEPYLAGNGYARIGEGSGTTNVLTNSGVDEAWASGVLLAEGVIELIRENKPFTGENLESAYVARRRNSWLEKESLIAEKARDGFQRGFISGLLGTALAGLTRGKLAFSIPIRRPHERISTLEEFYKNALSQDDIDDIRREAHASKQPLHDLIMNRCGWPEIPFDGKLLVSHQDALLMGGKVQAPGGFADHVQFANQALCEVCQSRICIEGCSGQAIMPGEDGGAPQFDREKCVYCGACMWNCAYPRDNDPERSNIIFGAGAGGLHSAEN